MIVNVKRRAESNLFNRVLLGLDAEVVRDDLTLDELVLVRPKYKLENVSS
jgi:hypothetical protein